MPIYCVLPVNRIVNPSTQEWSPKKDRKSKYVRQSLPSKRRCWNYWSISKHLSKIKKTCWSFLNHMGIFLVRFGVLTMCERANRAVCSNRSVVLARNCCVGLRFRLFVQDHILCRWVWCKVRIWDRRMRFLLLPSDTRKASEGTRCRIAVRFRVCSKNTNIMVNRPLFYIIRE